MKKLTLVLMMMLGFSIAFAQTPEKTKVKRTSTVGQKVHNVFSKHKHYNGYKVKKKVEKPKTVTKGA